MIDRLISYALLVCGVAMLGFGASLGDMHRAVEGVLAFAIAVLRLDVYDLRQRERERARREDSFPIRQTLRQTPPPRSTP